MALSTIGPLHVNTRALQARLETLFDPRLFRHRMVPARLDAATFAKLVDRIPFIGLGWSGVKPSAMNGRTFSGNGQWSVLLITQNQASVEGQYLGDAVAPGLFDLVHVATIGLQGWSLVAPDGARGGMVQIRSIQNSFADGWAKENAAIALVEFDILYEDDPPADWIAEGVSPNPVNLAIDWQFDGASQLLDTAGVSS